MRLATYNVEWFDALFDEADQLIEDDGPSGRQGVSRVDQIASIAIVLTALDADAVLIVEAPDHGGARSTVAALEGFAARFDLRTSRAVAGYASDSQQEIALLYDPARLQARHDPRGQPTGKRGSAQAPRFDSAFRWVPPGEETPLIVPFARPPLELDLLTVGGTRLRMIGVHIKSMAPHGAHDAGQIPRLLAENRRKQQAQSLWLRQRIDAHLDEGMPLIVLGDLNDGPRNGRLAGHAQPGPTALEIVMGAGRPGHERLHDRHAVQALRGPPTAAPSSARFLVADEAHYFSALLDYVLISPDLMAREPRWRIWHPFDDPACYHAPELREALLTASDHFPVSLDIAI
ncbi:endonuclease [Rhodobacteraceae bacterium WD3A24]|nr:endonuclease [Rhodobacteraceae bacterium WD3A24]